MKALLLAAMLGAQQPADDVILVKGVGPDTSVSVLATEAGGLVRADVVARLLGGAVDSIGPGVWRLTLYGTSVQLQDGLAFAEHNGYILPLLEPTRRVEQEPAVPLQLFSEILPRFGVGVEWERGRRELRLKQAVARAEEPPAPSAATPTPAPATSGPAVRPVANTRPGAARPATRLSRTYTVAVDAGHGGRDPGNLGVVLNGRRLMEKQLTLPIAMEVEKALRQKGLEVIMTRRTDTLIALGDRGPMANAAKADLFVSIHTNAANPNWRNPASYRGFETYFLSTAQTEDERRVEAMENEAVRFETEAGVHKGDPLSFILNDLAQNEHLRESMDLAQLIQDHLRESHPGPDRGAKQSNLAVLRTAYMPAVLVEVGFGTNLADTRWMSSPAGQRSTAQQIAEAVYEYLLHYERRTAAVQR